MNIGAVLTQIALPLWLLSVQPESNYKLAAFSVFRDDGQIAFVHVHDLPGNAQSDAGA